MTLNLQVSLQLSFWFLSLSLSLLITKESSRRAFIMTLDSFGEPLLHFSYFWFLRSSKTTCRRRWFNFSILHFIKKQHDGKNVNSSTINVLVTSMTRDVRLQSKAWQGKQHEVLTHRFIKVASFGKLFMHRHHRRRETRGIVFSLLITIAWWNKKDATFQEKEH